MRKTTNYKLNLPEGDDVIDIEVLDANFEKIDTELKKNAQAAGAYSAAPQRIGTWIDGMSIWRYAFSMDYSSGIQILAIDQGAYTPIGVHNYISDINQIKGLIGSYCEVCRTGCSYGDIIPRYKESSIDGGALFDLSQLTDLVRSTLNDDCSHGEIPKINGWIEFISPESNIK